MLSCRSVTQRNFSCTASSCVPVWCAHCNCHGDFIRRERVSGRGRDLSSLKTQVTTRLNRRSLITALWQSKRSRCATCEITRSVVIKCLLACSIRVPSPGTASVLVAEQWLQMRRVLPDSGARQTKMRSLWTHSAAMLLEFLMWSWPCSFHLFSFST